MANTKSQHRSIEMVDASFMEHVIKDPVSKCWVWQPKMFRFRHGLLFFNPRRYALHMEGYTIPAGRNVMSGCTNEKCVNPEHARLKHDGSSLDRSTPLYFDLGYERIVKDDSGRIKRVDKNYGHDFAYSNKFLGKKYHRTTHEIAKARRATLELLISIIGSRLPITLLATTYKIAPSYVKLAKEVTPDQFEEFKAPPPEDLHDDETVDPRVYQYTLD